MSKSNEAALAVRSTLHPGVARYLADAGVAR